MFFEMKIATSPALQNNSKINFLLNKITNKGTLSPVKFDFCQISRYHRLVYFSKNLCIFQGMLNIFFKKEQLAKMISWDIIEQIKSKENEVADLFLDLILSLASLDVYGSWQTFHPRTLINLVILELYNLSVN